METNQSRLGAAISLNLGEMCNKYLTQVTIVYGNSGNSWIPRSLIIQNALNKFLQNFTLNLFYGIK